MKTILLLLTICAIVVLSPSVFSQKGVQYMNDLGQERHLEKFSGICINGNFNVFIEQSSRSNGRNLTIEAKEDLLKRIHTVVRDGILHIFADDPENKKLIADIYLTINELTSIETYGTVTIETIDKIEISVLNISLNDRSKCILFVDSDTLKLDVSGNGYTEISGDIKTIELNVAGDAKVALELISDKLTCSIFEYGDVCLIGSAMIGKTDVLDSRIVTDSKDATKTSLLKKSLISSYERVK